ncbi:RsmF rRNA methyltransferase first C-terminal domain-containing protein [Marininema halotolerans]|uniref:NOL1/NOP2/sun family putative RNA methylase n=1 Tax=Marininema halotolerans TaxID=1155944 RepID=A0A1I6S7B6_9BACL|nr:RsmF rRNA methyltransferase first C-terminal domain-containing protein [Marininema halotolerans]SFS72826.1 NOL1/NOP2/sun family putative RNA methylase [Marininema halotolerans]
MHLPTDFRMQMSQLLQEESDSFFATYDEEPSRGLRMNALKLSPQDGKQRLPFALTPIPWADTGFFYDHHRDRPGKHVFHAAGLYYIQDPSAMAPAEALDPQPGERVLDLCAAPGGKTTQLAAKMQGDGILIANEISRERRKALIENLERCGVKNAIVLGEDPHHLTTRFAGWFDRILIDAPCSGEGMFRKDPATMERWSLRSTQAAAELQQSILEATAPMLKTGGRLVYSTCTFNPSENESIIQQFLGNHPEFQIREVPGSNHFSPARPDWAHANPSLDLAARLWPHRLRGEGHFLCVLEKKAGEEGARQKPGKLPPVHKEALHVFNQFVNETLTSSNFFPGPYTLFGDHLYHVPAELPSLKGLVVERPGLHLGQAKRKHFAPSHALALALQPDQVQRKLNFSPEDDQLQRYLRGEALPCQGEKGWTLVTVDYFPLGWGKVSGGLLKNHYPKWLRSEII